jgi:16S rRNA processing protein RimM
MEPRWLPFGVLGRLHGLEGEISLLPYNATGSRAWPGTLPADVRVVSSGDRVLATRIVTCRAVARGFLIRMAEILDRESGMQLVGGEVQVLREALPRLAQHEFFVGDVVGCEACLVDGKRLGLVKGTFWNGEHDVMSIVDDGGAESFLPLLPEFVLGFDAISRHLTVDLHE